MITIGKRFTFDAAHRLGRHEGKCSNAHGHTYTLEVDLTGPVSTVPDSGQGMVLDYYIIKKVIDEVVMKELDHKDLNVVLAPFLEGNPEVDNVTTAENMVIYLARILGASIRGYTQGVVFVSRVRLCETPNSWAEWRP